MVLRWSLLVCGLVSLFLLVVGAGAAPLLIIGLDLESELVILENAGDTPIDLSGWWIEDEGNIHRFVFPSFVLPVHTTVRIHTGSGFNTATDLYWGLGSDVWNNDGDVATVYDASGVRVSFAQGYLTLPRTTVSPPPTFTPTVPTPSITIPPGGGTAAQAYAFYTAGNTAWSKAWGASEIGQIRQYLNEAGNSFSLCRDLASQVDDPSNATDLAFMQSMSAAYVDLVFAANWMYEGSDMYSEGRTLMNAGDYVGAANVFGHAGETFQYSQTYFGQATTMLQGVSYEGTSFGDGTAYTAAIVPILNGKAAYVGEFASYARGWQHTALAYRAVASGDQAALRSEGTRAMDLFGGLRTSSTFGADATSNYNILAGLLA